MFSSARLCPCNRNATQQGKNDYHLQSIKGKGEDLLFFLVYNKNHDRCVVVWDFLCAIDNCSSRLYIIGLVQCSFIDRLFGFYNFFVFVVAV